jgi:hypothetical protein
MRQFRLKHAAKLTWFVAMSFLTIAVFQAGAQDETRRIWMLTLLTWLNFPISLVIVPVLNRLVGALDLESMRIIDSAVVLGIAIGGYAQWFYLVPFVSRRLNAE